MKRRYTVSKTRSIRGETVYYVHQVGFPYIPVMSEDGTFFENMQEAFKVAAYMNMEDHFSMKKDSIQYYSPPNTDIMKKHDQF